MSNEFLNDLKVTDKVGVYSMYNLGIATVFRVTKTMIITKNDGRYKKDNGRLVGGDSWSMTRLTELTPEFLEAFYTQQFLRRIRHAISNDKLKELNSKELEVIYKLIIKE